MRNLILRKGLDTRRNNKVNIQEETNMSNSEHPSIERDYGDQIDEDDEEES